MSIAFPIMAVTVIGLLLAVLLVVAARFMAVREDERIPAVRECLPGANCGSCGFAGCDGYAKALVEENAAGNLCIPGGAAAAQQIADILGREAGEVKEKTAFVRCGGDCHATADKLEYAGLASCSAVRLMFGGKGQCTFGCIGLGDCLKACTQEAICLENGIAHIDSRRCSGCGKCVEECPSGVIALVEKKPEKETAIVRCLNQEKGSVVRKICTAGCIGCGLCEKNCPSDAIKVENNLALVDRERCTGCGTCKEKCPSKCIL